jgi:hypothetical protein
MTPFCRATVPEHRKTFMADQESAAQGAKALLAPILDLVGGIDGGVAYAQLCHEILPTIIGRAAEGCEESFEVLATVAHFSDMCSIMLGRTETFAEKLSDLTPETPEKEPQPSHPAEEGV